MITLPKRKLRLWYNKNDYLKERENEKKQAEQVQSFDGPEQLPKDNSLEPNRIDESNQVTENIEEPKVQETKLPQNETQGETLPLETQAYAEKAEMSPIPTEGQAQISESNLKAQTENSTEQTSIVKENVEASATQNEEKTAEVNQIEPVKQTTIQMEKPIAINEGAEQAVEVQIQEENKESNGSVSTTSVVEAIQEEVQIETEVETENEVPLNVNVVNIAKYTDTLKRLLPTKAVVYIGEFPINIVLNDAFVHKKDESVLPIFIEKSSKDVIKWSQGRLDQKNIVCLDEDIDTHFWYDILPYVVNNEGFFGKIKSKPIEKLRGAILVSSTWNGIGSALLPILSTQFKEWNISSIALSLLPSKAQPLDNQFNTFASIGILASRDATLLLIDRDNLENYTGIDRNGFGIYGDMVANYLLELILAKETFVQELCELASSFDTKMFTALLASGVSLKIYDSIENMLDTALLTPLFTFDLSSATLLYVLVRMPFNLKEKFPRGKIERAVTNWFKDKANLESIYIADPIYVEDSSDRIDIALFVGGFETITRFAAVEKRVAKMKDQAVKKGLITEDDWQTIAKSLVK